MLKAVVCEPVDLFHHWVAVRRHCGGCKIYQEMCGSQLIWICGADCTYLFPTLCSMTSHWHLEVDHDEGIYATEMGKFYKSGFPLPL